MVGNTESTGILWTPADYKPAIRQIANLRYAAQLRESLMHYSAFVERERVK